MLSTLEKGTIRLDQETDRKQYFAVSGGFLEVKDNRVTILADSLEVQSP
jgi:F0F1-type ATP synthase epsilon subunit